MLPIKPLLWPKPGNPRNKESKDKGCNKDHTGIMSEFYRDYFGVTEQNMETTIKDLGSLTLNHGFKR